MTSRLRDPWAVLSLSLLSWVGSCSRDSSAAITVHILLSEGAPRPNYLLVSWLDDKQFLVRDIRVPSVGELPGEGSRLASVQIQIGANASNTRRVLARGMRGGELVAEGAALVVVEPNERRDISLVLKAGRLPDADQDGIPDEIDSCPNAKDTEGACRIPIDASPTAPDSGTDAATPALADAPGDTSIPPPVDARPADAAVDQSAMPPLRSPSLSLSSSAKVVTLGDAVTVSWRSMDTASCTASASPASPDWAGSKAVNGDQRLLPAQTTTYTLSCTGAGGNVTQSVTIMVEPRLGLVAWYRFDESVGLSASDSSGNRNQGAIAGARWVAGRTGGAIAFDGVDDYVQVAHAAALNPSRAFTIALWFNMARLPPGPMGDTFINKGDWNADNSISVVLYLGSLRCNIGRAWGGGVDYPLSRFVPGRWYHVGCVADEVGHRLYIDGVEVAVTTKPVVPVTTTGDLFIGLNANRTTGFLSGAIDDLWIIARALSPGEIRSLADRP